jgi:hypothetical protein
MNEQVLERLKESGTPDRHCKLIAELCAKANSSKQIYESLNGRIYSETIAKLIWLNENKETELKKLSQQDAREAMARFEPGGVYIPHMPRTAPDFEPQLSIAAATLLADKAYNHTADFVAGSDKEREQVLERVEYVE